MDNYIRNYVLTQYAPLAKPRFSVRYYAAPVSAFVYPKLEFRNSKSSLDLVSIRWFRFISWVFNGV